MTEMKLSKVFKKDIEKYLGIIPDRRRKDFKQYIAENGGYENAIKTLKSRLNEKTEFKAKKEVRQKQVKTQKEYVERKKEIRPKTDVKRKGRKSKKSIEAATKIQRFYTIQKQINRERTKLFSLEPSKIWNTKYSYNLHNGLPSSIIRIDEKSGETLLLTKDDMVQVFQYYKIDKYLIQKLKEQKQSYKINLGYSITAKDLLTGKYNEIKSILKSYTIYGKSDIYKYFEEVYDEFSYYCDIYNKGVVTINNIILIFTK